MRAKFGAMVPLSLHALDLSVLVSANGAAPCLALGVAQGKARRYFTRGLKARSIEWTDLWVFDHSLLHLR